MMAKRIYKEVVKTSEQKIAEAQFWLSRWEKEANDHRDSLAYNDELLADGTRTAEQHEKARGRIMEYLNRAEKEIAASRAYIAELTA